jgi:hypothetical protein
MQLKRSYLELNRKYFRNRLPKKAVVEFNQNKMRGAEIGRAHACGETKCMKGCKGPAIWISEKLKPFDCFTEMTLLHEMVHLAIDLGGRRRNENEHGRRWQRQMKDLAARGAFRDLW